ncbi:MAG: SDR family NAD(P)-dependent oxidoreductase [Bowdeniella nasicola]|nr:SDR family NAD(P)-dependent oxidoreductase [Bowdeniella nasicola]
MSTPSPRRPDSYARPHGARRQGCTLITGASSGFGTEWAWQLAARGHDVVLVARRAERLSALAHDLRQIAGVNAEVLVADLATSAGRAAVVARLTSSVERPIDLLVNNAGFGLGQPFVDGDLEREVQAVEVMIRAVLELSHAAAHAMIPRRRGAIVNVSSVAAYTAMGTYASAKMWVRSFTEALAAELRGSGVSATAVSPGLMHTEFHGAAHMDDSAWPAIGWIDAEYVVTETLRAVARGATHVTPTARYRLAQLALRLAPRPVISRLVGPSRWAPALRGEPAATRHAP